MSRSKTVDFFVIFARPEQFQAPNHYYAMDGNATSEKCNAAKFDSFDEAKDFAQTKGIELTNTVPYIGRETFSA